MLSSSFFFSSRRRHTRFDCDWSSDVCSSDLLKTGSSAAITLGSSDRLAYSFISTFARASYDYDNTYLVSASIRRDGSRSEERRVGKECRSRWARDHYKKKEDENKIKQDGVSV